MGCCCSRKEVKPSSVPLQSKLVHRSNIVLNENNRFVTEQNSVIKVYKSSTDISVVLLGNQKIRKRFPDTENGRRQYENEKKAYSKLANEPSIPDLIGFNDKTRSLYIQKIHSHPPKTKPWKRKLCAALTNINTKLRTNVTSYDWNEVRNTGEQIYLVGRIGTVFKTGHS
jgi:hypothetical protein